MDKRALLIILLIVNLSFSSGIKLDTADAGIKLDTADAGIKLDTADVDLFLLAEKTYQMEFNEIYTSLAASDPYDIEWEVSYFAVFDISIEHLSDSRYIEKMEINYDIDGYQKRTGNTYSPVSYGLEFYDENDNLLGSDKDGSLVINIESIINIETGEIISVKNPFNADHYYVVTYYDDSNVYSSNGIYVPLASVGDKTEHYYPESEKWKIGDYIDNNNKFLIVNEDEVYDHNAWRVEYLGIPNGFSTFDYYEYIEQSSGLTLETYLVSNAVNKFNWQFWYYPLDLNDVIDNGFPVISSNKGKSIDLTTSTTSISFTVEENNFEKYVLYSDNEVYESGIDYKSTYSFIVPVNLGNTTWTLEIVDTLGYASNASTWIEGLSTNSNNSDAGPLPFLFPFDFICFVIIKRKKNK